MGQGAGRSFARTGHAMRTMEAVAVAAAQHEPVLLVGETGTGKTTLVQEIAQQVRPSGCHAWCAARVMRSPRKAVASESDEGLWSVKRFEGGCDAADEGSLTLGLPQSCKRRRHCMRA